MRGNESASKQPVTVERADSPLEPLPRPQPKATSQWAELSQVIGWAQAIAAPLLMLWSGRYLGMDHDQTLFAALLRWGAR